MNHFSNKTVWGKTEGLCLLILLSQSSVIKCVQGQQWVMDSFEESHNPSKLSARKWNLKVELHRRFFAH